MVLEEKTSTLNGQLTPFLLLVPSFQDWLAMWLGSPKVTTATTALLALISHSLKDPAYCCAEKRRLDPE